MAAPQAWGQSQYYGTASDYPDVKTHNHTYSSDEGTYQLYLMGAGGAGAPTLQTFYSSVTGNQQNPTYGVNPYSLSPGIYDWAINGGDGVGIDTTLTSNSNSWYNGVVALPTTNQGSQTGTGHSGVFIPVGWIMYKPQNNEYLVGWQPQQNTTIAVSGFTCSGWTCTTADGSQWDVSNVNNNAQSAWIQLVPATPSG